MADGDLLLSIDHHPSFRMRFAELALEAMFRNTEINARRAGIIITREEFWRTPGIVVFSVPGYLELMRAGVVSMSFNQQFPVPRDKLGIVRNGRN